MKTAPETFTRPVPPPPPDPLAQAVVDAQAGLDTAQAGTTAAAETLRRAKARLDDARSRVSAAERREKEEAERIGREAYLKPFHDRAAALDRGIQEALGFVVSALIEHRAMDRTLRERFGLPPQDSPLRAPSLNHGAGEHFERIQIRW